MIPFDAALDATPTHAAIRVSGELDIATAPLLQAAIDEAQAADVPVIVDLTATSFCDSTGMSAVLKAHKHQQDRHRAFVLVCPAHNREVTRVLQLLGFDAVLTVRDTLGAAVAEVT